MNRKQYENKIICDTEIRCQIESVAASCSFKTIPKGLRQHPIPVAIIHSAIIRGSCGKLPDPSVNYTAGFLSLGVFFTQYSTGNGPRTT